MDTSPKDQQALLWDHTAPKMAPVKKPRELVWELRKNHRTYRGELLGHGEFGWEAQVSVNDVMIYGHRFDTRELALLDAEQCRRLLEADQWALPDDLESFS
jgi:hypothetical protein